MTNAAAPKDGGIALFGKSGTGREPYRSRLAPVIP